MTADDGNGLRTTERSLAIVEYIHRQCGATFGEIRTGMNLAKSTTSQHLRTLQREGLLRKVDGRYHVGLR